MRKLAAALALATALVAVALAGTAAAQTGGGCRLQGNADFSPGLNTSSKAFSYSFAGQLTGCQSNQ